MLFNHQARKQEAMSPKILHPPVPTCTLILAVALTSLVLALEANGELPLICPDGRENITREELCNDTVVCEYGEDNGSTTWGRECFGEALRCCAFEGL